MRNSKILNIPQEHIEETLKTKPETLFENQKGKCIVHLKDFDYYYVFCIRNTQNYLNNYSLKLPKKFAEAHSSSYENLLNEFLKIVGVPTADGKLITSFNTKKHILGLNPTTANRIQDITYGIQNDDIIDFFFCVDIIKYRDFLEDYKIRT